MYKIILLLICFVFGFQIFCDEFEDYIHSCERLSRNFNRAVSAPESRIGEDYRMYLNTAKEQAKKIQKVILQLNLGSDFDFPALTAEVESIYTMRTGNKKMRKAQNGLQDLSENPNGVFFILLFDVRNLRKLEFTTEDGGNIRSDFATKRRIYEYERYFQFFYTMRNKYSSKSNKDDASFRRFFVLRCQRLAGLAKKLHIQIRNKNPHGVSKINLDSETALMLSDFQKLMEYSSKPQKHKAEHRSGNHSRKRSGKKNKKVMQEQDSIDNLHAEIRVCHSNISKLIHELKYSDFTTDPPLNIAGRNGGRSDDPANILKEPGSKVKNYKAMNETALMKELWKRRQTIIKGNTSIDGFDSKSERDFMKTLTSDQKKKFNKYLKDDLNLGYEREIAVRNVLLRIQSEMQMSKEYPSKKELIRILEAMDKDKENQNKNLKVSF